MSPKLRLDAGSLVADPSAYTAKSKPPCITIQDRLENGNLTIDEVCELKNRSKTGFYADLKAGLVTIRKIGRKSIVPGPIARRYIAGESVVGA
jgi:hypothetical protein